jgi:hypothetical protein
MSSPPGAPRHILGYVLNTIVCQSGDTLSDSAGLSVVINRLHLHYVLNYIHIP